MQTWASGGVETYLLAMESRWPLGRPEGASLHLVQWVLITISGMISLYV